jgi:hypothetical protein
VKGLLLGLSTEEAEVLSRWVDHAIDDVESQDAPNQESEISLAWEFATLMEIKTNLEELAQRA